MYDTVSCWLRLDMSFSVVFFILIETTGTEATSQAKSTRGIQFAHGKPIRIVIQEESSMEWVDLVLSSGLLCLAYLLLFTTARSR